MPRKSTYAYDENEAAYFIKYLGCHKYADPVTAVRRRDPHQYRLDLLERIMKNKMTRTNGDGELDESARWENAAALAELEKLGEKLLGIK